MVVTLSAAKTQRRDFELVKQAVEATKLMGAWKISGTRADAFQFIAAAQQLAAMLVEYLKEFDRPIVTIRVPYHRPDRHYTYGDVGFRFIEPTGENKWHELTPLRPDMAPGPGRFARFMDDLPELLNAIQDRRFSDVVLT